MYLPDTFFREVLMRSSIAVLLVLAASTAACGRKGARSSDFDSATAAALAGGTPTGSTGVTSPPIARAMGFDFGHRIDRSGRIEGGVVTEFAPTDSILMSVRAAGADTTTEVSARIRFAGKTVDSQGVRAPRPDSTGVSFTPLRFGFAKALAAGTYQVDVFVNGKFQMAQNISVAR